MQVGNAKPDGVVRSMAPGRLVTRSNVTSRATALRPFSLATLAIIETPAKNSMTSYSVLSRFACRCQLKRKTSKMNVLDQTVTTDNAFTLKSTC